MIPLSWARGPEKQGGQPPENLIRSRSMQQKTHARNTPLGTIREAPAGADGAPVVFLSHHLETLTSLVMTRFSSASAEEARLAEIRMLLGAAADLSRALEIQSHYVLVDHRGTYGANDLRAAGREFFRALDEYARALRELAERYPDLTSPFDPQARLSSSAAPPEGKRFSTPIRRLHANDIS